MTIICIKDNVVAADGSSWDGHIMVVGDRRKIIRSEDGAIGAACGTAGSTLVFRRYFQFSNADRRRAGGVLTFDKESGFEAVWLEPDGQAWCVGFDGWPYAVAQPAASGAAYELALGAMYAGASAEEAVRICIERHDGAGGEVFVERLEARSAVTQEEAFAFAVGQPAATSQHVIEDSYVGSIDRTADEEPLPGSEAYSARLNRMGIK